MPTPTLLDLVADADEAWVDYQAKLLALNAARTLSASKDKLVVDFLKLQEPTSRTYRDAEGELHVAQPYPDKFGRAFTVLDVAEEPEPETP